MKDNHDVFISFRGTDVRHGLLSHLKKDLRREKIDFYVDDDKLERGGQISSSLLKAIQESTILLVIFSKNYASSKWCLAELEKIIKCAKKNKEIAVVPVFYKVDPSDVRHQRGDYAAALVEHEIKEGRDQAQKWRSALEKAAGFAGFHYPLDSELDESDVVDKIVEDISSKLRKFSSSESDDPAKSNGLVGMDKNIGWINSLMTNNSEQVLKLGLWGMGGIGKTTIAQLVFDKFSHQYEGSYFLRNITDELKSNQLDCLRDKVVSKLLGEENPHITGASKANSSTMRRLSKKKVLLVLDNVNTPKLLRDFLEPIHFGPGSRVIVTSRNKQVFSVGGFNKRHLVKELNSEDSLELFCLNAFNESQPKRGFKELSVEAVAIAKGVPLALKVFGSYLHSKSNDIWKCALERFKKYPDPDGEIQSVLRFSYDELVDTEKRIFLDIAFFFKEENKRYVISQLDLWNFYGASGIASLQEKALITISKDNKIQMHDLLQKMGWEIVRQESATPGGRSRVNDPVEVSHILKNDKGSDSVEGILLDISQIGEVALNLDSLKKMPNLRLVKVYSPLPVEVPRQIRSFVPQVPNVPKNKQMDELIEGLLEKSGRLNQSCDNEKIHDVLLEAIKDLANNTKGSMLDKSTQPIMLSKLSKLGGGHKFENYNESDGVLVLGTNDLSRSMPRRNPNIGSAMKELMSLESEFHVKSTHDLFMKGCLVSKRLSFLSTKKIRAINSTLNGMKALNSSMEIFKNQYDENVLPEETSQPNLKDTTIELLNCSTKSFISHDYSDIDDLQLETTRKDELSIMRSTDYYRLSNCREKKDSGKSKLLVLFDGLRYCEQMSLLDSGLCCLWPKTSDTPWSIFSIEYEPALSIKSLSIAELLPSIQSLYIYDCMWLKSLPSSIKNSSYLEDRSFYECSISHAVKTMITLAMLTWEKVDTGRVRIEESASKSRRKREKPRKRRKRRGNRKTLRQHYDHTKLAGRWITILEVLPFTFLLSRINID